MTCLNGNIAVEIATNIKHTNYTCTVCTGRQHYVQAIGQRQPFQNMSLIYNDGIKHCAICEK